ncbi:hypothetical protein MESS2_1520026 [Mesorhizobium metallidurans STM 2683]|uniref:Uncharacterized protein n=1 Tax=Mesorhizobium metallidurans STM 2683 TaxID=1297569 RepID=M5ELM9_9HYPH|nr:hypothetical protein MESS2_1520026 [Mesorhizobium metallidurans STM 2683]
MPFCDGNWCNLLNIYPIASVI